MNERIKPRELLAWHVGTLFRIDAQGKLVEANEPWERRGPAPRLYLARSIDGAWEMRVHSDLPDEAAQALALRVAEAMRAGDALSQGAVDGYCELLPGGRVERELCYAPQARIADGTGAETEAALGGGLSANEARADGAAVQHTAGAQAAPACEAAANDAAGNDATADDAMNGAMNDAMNDAAAQHAVASHASGAVAVVRLTADALWDVDLAGIGWTREEMLAAAPCTAVLVDGRIAAHCASVRIAPHACEAGIETQPAYRGRGYAGRALAAWTDDVARLGRLPMYSTSPENIASQRVAAKAGYAPYAAGVSIL